MKFLTKIFSAGAGDLIEKVGSVADKFITTSEEREKLKQEMLSVINSHEQRMAEIAQGEHEAALKDTADARAREIAIANSGASWLSKNITSVLAIGILGLTFALWYLVLFKKIPEGVNKEALMIVIGSLSTMSAGVVGYYFGSSVGSKAKQESMEKMMNS